MISKPILSRTSSPLAPAGSLQRRHQLYQRRRPQCRRVVASFDARSVTYGFGELDMLVPAYAATIHKSQGSEYPAVIIPVLTQHYAMLQRNLLYTGVTCGRRLVVLVGQKNVKTPR